ncbi:hypothetical protein [Arthrobacter sp. FW306-04-A]|uniref:DUF7793 family protein n=1 Tax=Arthrobacter sp. FW306-04-A TaxID=2879619 RepID=UPI0037C1AD23|nr:hypothetical protein LFT43_18600 [Arthrobacter sp. FW306-04-A]
MTTLVQTEDESHLQTDVDAVTVAVGTDGPAPSGADSANVTMEDAGDGILRITLRPESRITAEDGTLVRERYIALTGGTGGAVSLQITGVESVSRDAVRFFSEAVTITAFAILGSTPVDRVVAHGRRGLPTPQCPTQYFSDEQVALAWLRAATAGGFPSSRVGAIL